MAQISDIKELLLKDVDNIVVLLEEYDFCHINLRPNEIRFARDEQGGKNISIRLQNNEWLNVADYSHGFRGDIFSFITQERGVTFREVLLSTKKILKLDDRWEPKKRASLFGGIYQHVGKNAKPELKTYDESILDEYPKCGNIRFLMDHISLESQMKFGLMYSIVSQRILIPIRDIFGNLVGLKSRRNYETDNPDDPKYVFDLPTQKAMVLYGAHENYQYLMNADRIVIGEAEKFVQACDSYNYNSAVSMMGSMLSVEQCKILLGFNAKEYCFMMDEGIDIQIIFRNAELLRSFATMREVKITYFDYRDSLSVGEKESPTDGGRDNFYYILENEIKELTEEEDDEI